MDKKSLNSSLEIWGGIECTINRIDDFYLDQLQYANHYSREEDLDLLATLGIKTIRYPVLWERIQPQENGEFSWEWNDNQLSRLRELGITPIAGLLHHGSGPVFTNLEDPEFTSKFIQYATQVATRYPWIEYYTPINEPLTTARFSGLYGFWYPHKRNDISFARMFLNQMKATVLSMKAIRQINPSAKLVQTEDLGKTYSSPGLEYQAKFENERRWLTYDILCGLVKPGHSMWDYFFRLGIPTEHLQFFVDNPCPPDIMGFNHYITSERYLDANFKKYPDYTRGGNELQEYADVEAVRVPQCKRKGLKALLEEAWQKYKIPLAITEAQLNCTREDQLRWLHEIWQICTDLNAEDIKIVAVTAWSLLGAFGWNNLLTSTTMEYEPGAFDLRAGVPRPTALADMIKKIASTGNYAHPLMAQKGWWHRENKAPENSIIDVSNTLTAPVLIIGKRGTLGRSFAKACSSRAINYILLGREDLDITNPEQIEEVIIRFQPWAIVNAAGFVRVDEAELNTDECFRVNTLGPKLLAAAARNHSVGFMTFSSDLVFDGQKTHAYKESDPVNPLNKYGSSKAEAEIAVLKEYHQSLVIRTSAFFGPWDEHNFVYHALKTIGANTQFRAADDICVSPTYVPDLVNVSLDLLIDRAYGIWHLANHGEVTWAQLAMILGSQAGFDTDLIIPTPGNAFNFSAPRPKYTVLQSDNGVMMPSLNSAIARFFDETKAFSTKLLKV